MRFEEILIPKLAFRPNVSVFTHFMVDDLKIIRTVFSYTFHRFRSSFIRNSPAEGKDFYFDGTILKVNKVQLVDRLGSEPNIVGTIHVTTSHVIFKADESAKEFWIANGLIGSVERGALTVLGSPLILRCKHFLVLTFLISKDKECQDLFETLVRCSKPVNILEVFAFENRERNGERHPGQKHKGWCRLDWRQEFARQGIGAGDRQMWKITEFNVSYKHCDTYPELLCVPSAASTQTLIGSCRFRSRARLPVLTYWHRTNATSLSRCAQPLTGFSARCVEDELLMNLIAKTNTTSDKLYLVDTRPRMNAMVNKMQGKGFEDGKNYSNIRFHFFDIENIHVMRSSLNKFLEAIQRSRSVTDYYKQLESSGWLKHVKCLLECGVFLAKSMTEGISCVVHCSDGWDRTAQTVSVAQLLLDPFYRTIRGFQILIEKDWLGFGHKFDDRCGHVGAFNEDAAKEVSPIFAQFLDAVYQLLRQYPSAFEFNERYLITIHENAYSCQYGTFLGNCDKDRKDLNLPVRTQSLWALMDETHDDYINPFYEANRYSFLGNIDLHPSAVVVWSNMYNRFDAGILPKENVQDVAISALEHIGVLESHMASIREKLAGLKRGLSKSLSGAMVDSGLSSSSSNPRLNSHPLEFTADNGKVFREGAAESNVSGSETLNDSCSQAEEQDRLGSGSSIFRNGDGACLPAVHWQSLRGADECSSRSCGAEFATRGERRLHCYRCGKIHCRRCIKMTEDGRERICDVCAAAIRVD